MSRIIMGPFNRVEGDLEVQLDVHDGLVTHAHVCAPMYRGFENLLLGRDPYDALTIAPRICGICSVSQSMAAARALADASGAQPPSNGALACNLMLACENLADHLTHLFVFFLPDFTRPLYATRDWYAQACQRYGAFQGLQASHVPGARTSAVLATRARWLQIIGQLGGKWPHTGAILPGGSSRSIDASERMRLLALVREMRASLEADVLGGTIEALLSLNDVGKFEEWCHRAPQSDLGFFWRMAQDSGLSQLGHGPGRLLSYGAYPDQDGLRLWRPGVMQLDDATSVLLDIQTISEDVHHAWLHTGPEQRALHPSEGVTLPAADKSPAYSWSKAPRLQGSVVETGALARQCVDGLPLARALVRRYGACVLTRVVARLLETGRIVAAMERWLKILRPGEPYHLEADLPAEASGVGLVEAARGSLGHWISVQNGRISRYQIVAPTSWNFSPRDAQGQPGALETALVGAPMDPGAPQHSVAVQHIVRSFDPCMACTVH